VGCAGCTKHDGCEAEKGPQRTLIERVFELVYPDGTWGHPDDEARFGAGVRPREVRRLGRAISTATRAPTFVRAGGPDDLCEFVYVLCVGRLPALIDVREGLAAPEAPTQREQYLRVAFSTVARAAAIQEVALELDGDELRELPRPGVYDDKLLKRMRAIVDLVEAHEIEHLDFGMVDKPFEGARPGPYVERYGVEPMIVNFLFYAQPPRTQSVTLLPSASLPLSTGRSGDQETRK
jgi:hypothetical protein